VLGWSTNLTSTVLLWKFLFGGGNSVGGLSRVKCKEAPTVVTQSYPVAENGQNPKLSTQKIART